MLHMDTDHVFGVLRMVAVLVAVVRCGGQPHPKAELTGAPRVVLPLIRGPPPLPCAGAAGGGGRLRPVARDSAAVRSLLDFLRRLPRLPPVRLLLLLGLRLWILAS